MRNSDIRDKAVGRTRLGYVATVVAVGTLVLMAFAPPIVTFGAGVSSAVAWSAWLEAHGDDADR